MAAFFKQSKIKTNMKGVSISHEDKCLFEREFLTLNYSVSLDILEKYHGKQDALREKIKEFLAYERWVDRVNEKGGMKPVEINPEKCRIGNALGEAILVELHQLFCEINE